MKVALNERGMIIQRKKLMPRGGNQSMIPQTLPAIRNSLVVLKRTRFTIHLRIRPHPVNTLSIGLVRNDRLLISQTVVPKHKAKSVKVSKRKVNAIMNWCCMIGNPKYHVGTRVISELVGSVRLE